MPFELPALPYHRDALSPVLSTETLDYHYGKHHQGYVNKLNTLVADTEYADQTLEGLIRTTEGAVFNNASQIWNHSFYWNCLSPDGGGEPEARLAASLEHRFESVAAFREAFNQSAIRNFGSGWTWLVQGEDGNLEITNTNNAGNPVRQGLTPLFTVDVWEHAYYIDYRNSRTTYLEKIWDIVNWDFIAANLS